jgi:hypothetical protein
MHPWTCRIAKIPGRVGLPKKCNQQLCACVDDLPNAFSGLQNTRGSRDEARLYNLCLQNITMAGVFRKSLTAVASRLISASAVNSACGVSGRFVSRVSIPTATHRHFWHMTAASTHGLHTGLCASRVGKPCGCGCGRQMHSEAVPGNNRNFQMLISLECVPVSDVIEW